MNFLPLCRAMSVDSFASYSSANSQDFFPRRSSAQSRPPHCRLLDAIINNYSVDLIHNQTYLHERENRNHGPEVGRKKVDP